MGLRKDIRIFGQDYPTRDGTCVRDYVHVADLAEAHLLAMESLDRQESNIYNLGNGQGFTVREVVESAERVTGRTIPVVEELRRAGDPGSAGGGVREGQGRARLAAEFTDLDSIVSQCVDLASNR